MDIPESADLHYHGESQAIHVEEGDEDLVEFTYEHPATREPHYRGASQPIITREWSPEGLVEGTINGSALQGPHYHGNSQAIHVRGDTEVTPPPPIDSCYCEDFAGDLEVAGIYVFNKEINHSGDPLYLNAPGAVKVVVTDDGAGTFFYYTQGLSGTHAYWQRNWDNFEHRVWFGVGGIGSYRAKVDFDPTYGRSGAGAALPVRVGIYTYPGTAGTIASPASSSVNPLDNRVPIAVVDAGEWFPTGGTTVYISPVDLPHTAPAPDGEGNGHLYWAMPQNGGADAVYYPPDKAEAPFGDPFSRANGGIPYEGFVITVENGTTEGGGSEPNEDCDCGDGAFDNFDNRETSNALDPAEWGVVSSDPGIEWELTDQNGAPLSPSLPDVGYGYVDNGLGILTVRANVSANVCQARLVEGPPIGTDDFTMTIRFRIPFRLTTPDAPNYPIASLDVRLTRASGTTISHKTVGYVTENLADPLGMDPNVWYIGKFQSNAAEQKYKVKRWRETDPEPAVWDDEDNWFPGDHVVTLFRLVANASGPPATVVPDTAEFHLDWVDFDEDCECAGCAACADALPFTPGYLPIFRPQFGDPTTSLDAFLCTMESGAMALDWHTRGGTQIWGGTLLAASGRSESSVIGSGTNLGDVRNGWAAYGEIFSNRSGQTWANLIVALDAGCGVVLQGDYDQLSLSARCQDDFEDNHAIFVMPYKVGTKRLVGDPLCDTYKGVEESMLQAYAEDFGAQVFGAQSPQPILFGVTRPWLT